MEDSKCYFVFLSVCMMFLVKAEVSEVLSLSTSSAQTSDISFQNEDFSHLVHDVQNYTGRGPGENYACSHISSGDFCVSQNCVWCATDQQCHAPGSFANPCTNECCASKSFRSMCHYWGVSDIPPECVTSAMNTTSFSLDIARVMLALSASSFCNASALYSWTCKPCRGTNFTVATVMQDPSQFLQAYIGTTFLQFEGGSEEHIVIVFRGTVSSSILDWLVDFKVLQTSPYPEYPEIKVHSGFYAAYNNSLQAQVLHALQDLPPLPIVVTGHSMGAALAMLCAWDLKIYHNYPITSVYTFGQPRTGNFEFATTYASLVPNLWRATHAHDIVPHVPTAGQNYFHSQFEVFFPNDDLEFMICNSSGEDGKCSNRCAASLSCTSIADHLLYLGVLIGTDQCI